MDEMALDDQAIRPIIEGSDLVGGIYYMNYDEGVIVSNDKWKDDAGGIPRHCYLLATATDWENPDEFEEEDAYAVLLRATGPEKLPAEDDLMKVREEAMRRKITNDTGVDTRNVPGSSEEIMDVLTKNEIQFSGINAKILGTIYETDDGVQFGSDVETFYSSARYKVYKPRPEALSKIFQLIQLDQSESDDSVIRLGRVRYTSTERNSELYDATVPLDINDVVGNKTALFGMTRTGKSNTMKVLATNIFEHAVETDQEIGQLLFDPAGEYANVNTQDDETALADIHDDVVTVYSWGGGGDDVESLQIDFFDYQQIDEVWQTIKLHLTRDRDYVNSFKAANPVAPEQQDDNRGEVNEAVRCQSALYACLIRAGFETPNGFSTPIPTNVNVRNAVNAHLDDNDPDFENSDFGPSGWSFVDENRLEEFWDIVANNREDINNADEDWITNDVEAMLTMFNQEAGNGYQILEELRRYHDPGTQGYYPDIIYDSLADGDIVIVDLTSGTDEINQRISKTIVERVVERQVDMFTNGQEPHNIEVYVEEAHRLFGSDYLDDADATDPYVRLAKEAAKYNIGLIYATQEVSGVDGRVLANTANWIVTHLNNRNETKELSRYYNFEDFERLTLEAEDVGFARVKTLSGQFIVPTQIDKFDQDLITRAGNRYEQRYGDGDSSRQETL
ncbi:ATP-binding protein [Natranaeroarchaeum aerophilus]|uniref:DUF87 domain-containing protein n=1 Tax=Natranaeroarchaeum aerophilus TaxID=2917711 RepID=A0AAE3K3B0_9EURY|nr:DUF87 domain-containing protein [Natranaeroarchaeum aerophilus]MCL9812517.1 DUF87 domain-containing protein [Natranaeroarchaeum aerophilus]